MNIKFFIEVPVKARDEGTAVTRGDVQSITDDFVRLVEAWFATYNESNNQIFGSPSVSRAVADTQWPGQKEFKLEFED